MAIRYITIFLLLGFFLSGCSAVKSPFAKKDERPQSLSIPDSVQQSLDKGETMLVGDLVRFGNVQDVLVYGFGLVRGLAGTGSFERDGVDRAMVLREMQRHEIPQAMEILRSNTTAVVRLTSIIPPGSQIGDAVDVTVLVPGDSETSSLRGGWLLETQLQDAAILEGQFREGKGIASTQGTILINPREGREMSTELKRGTILGGAILRQPRIVHILVRPEAQSVFVAERVAREINHRFYLPNQNNKGVASAKDDSLVMLEIPPMYQRNLQRYLRVIRSIALYENPAKRAARLELLKQEIFNPQTAEFASYQLEAIGADAVPVLRSALNSDSDEIRFYAAMSLAYLNDHSASRQLAYFAQHKKEFRRFALEALSVIRDNIDAEEKLTALLQDSCAETRYGAFRALVLRNAELPLLNGVTLGGQFRYHVLATSGTPLIHLTKTRRQEIVLFSTDIRLKTPFSLDAGSQIVVTSKGADTVVVSKFVAQGVDESRMVSTRLDEIIRAVVELGGTYPDVVQMLDDAKQQNALTCPMETDLLAETGGVYRKTFLDVDDETEITPAAEKPSGWERLNPKTWFSSPTSREHAIENNVNNSGRE